MQSSNGPNQDAVLTCLRRAHVVLRGREIAERTGLTSKQVATAVDTLNRKGLLDRTGAKYGARWAIKGRFAEPAPEQAWQALHNAMGGKA